MASVDNKTNHTSACDIEMESAETNVDEKIENVEVIKAPDKYYGVRHTQTLFLFTLLAIGYGVRVSLSVGIVAMTDPSINPGFTTYDWKDQSVVLSSFFWGYMVPQILAGHVARRHGAKWVLIGAMTVGSIFSILIPFMAELGSWGVMICRIVQGLSQGFFYPSVHTMLSKWAPVPERSRLGGFACAGGIFGTVVSLPLSGWICGSNVGWPFVFYMYGIVGFLWVLAFFYFGSNGPEEHTKISLDEKQYIEGTIGEKSVNSKNISTPWKAIAKSLPVWAIFVAQCSENWGFWTLMTELPTYMKYVLDFNITANGLLSACPYLTMWIMSFFFSGFTDYIINKKYVTTGTGRKIANSVGLYIPAGALILLGFFGHGTDAVGLVIALLIIAVGVNAAHLCGYIVNHIDLAPNYAGTLMGITNGFATTTAILGPLFVHYIVTDLHDVSKWKIIFLTAAGIFICGNTFFVIFGSGEVQPWNAPDSDDNTKDIESAKEKTEDDVTKL